MTNLKLGQDRSRLRKAINAGVLGRVRTPYAKPEHELHRLYTHAFEVGLIARQLDDQMASLLEKTKQPSQDPSWPDLRKEMTIIEAQLDELQNLERVETFFNNDRV